MSAEPTLVYPYQVGGSLDINHPTYIVRQADYDLYEGLKAGEFCYVLNSRQMGKSSLRVRTMHRLRDEGIACAAIDLTMILERDVTPEQLYRGIIQQLVSSFQLKVDWRSWWRERNDLSCVQRFSEFINDVLLVKVVQNIVIFMDEIDKILRLNFKDDFFAVIRAFYNQRVDNPEYKRLTFALLGVATPSDLIEDKNLTPFNIGRAIELKGFQLDEAQPLAQGLMKVGNPQTLLKDVLNWTGGQPFLTQKLCKLILTSNSSIPEGSEAERIKQLVRSRIIENWEYQDEPEHLRVIRNRILSREQRTSKLLGIYQQILQKREIIANDSLAQMELRLSGLVVKEQGRLRVYNRIYKAVFNKSWVEKALAELRPYGEAIAAWLASNCQDESRLLRGQALQDALVWAVGKSLSDQDYQFLAASQEFDKREVQRALEAEKQESQILAEANRTLTEAQRRAKRIIRGGFAGLAVISVLAIMIVVMAERKIERWPEWVKNERCDLKQKVCEFGDYKKPAYVQGIGGFYVDLISPNSSAKIYWLAKKCNDTMTLKGEKHISTSTTGRNYIDFPNPTCSFRFTVAQMSTDRVNGEHIDFVTNFDVDHYPLHIFLSKLVHH